MQRYRVRIPIVVDEGEKMGMVGGGGFDMLSLLSTREADIGVNRRDAQIILFVTAEDHAGAVNAVGKLFSAAMGTPHLDDTSNEEAKIRRSKLHEVKEP